MNDANYRKHNDGSLNSSTYHKKDGTPSRQILKREAKAEITEEQIFEIEKSLDDENIEYSDLVEDSFFDYTQYLRDCIVKLEDVIKDNGISICIGDGTTNAGCGFSENVKWSGETCPKCNGMILSIEAIRAAAISAKVWMRQENNE